MRVIEYFPKTGIDCERIRAVSYHVTTAERRNFAEWCYVHSDAVCLIIGVFRQILRFHPESIRMDLAQNARSKLFLQSSVVGLSPFLNPLGSVLKLPNQQFDFHDIPHGFEKRSHVHHGSEALSYDARSLFSCKFNSAARMDT